MSETAQARVLQRLDGTGPLAMGLVLLIFLNVAAVILESVEAIHASFQPWFEAFEWFSLTVFSVEYVVRLWAAPANPAYAARAGRLRYAVSFMAIIDLVAILPSFLLLANVFPAVDLRALRVARFFRFARLLRVLKLGRYSQSAHVLARVVHDRRADLAVALGAVAILLVLSSSLMYAAESKAQPEAFASIPHAMWWAIVTLTTTGYGDIVPTTTLGRFLGAFTAILGVMIVALPAAIMASGFIDELQSRRAAEQPTTCPHCGKEIAASAYATRLPIHGARQAGEPPRKPAP